MVLMAIGCEKATLPTYDHPANIFFQLDDNSRDSIIYTFAYDMTKAQDTVYILTRLTGIRENRARRYAAYVEQDSSSAVAGQHYKPLEPEYALAADSGWAYLPLIIYNAPDLEEKSVSVIIKLKATEDFGIENPDIIRAKVVFSARLEKPHWWDAWPLAPYSRVKHQLFILVTGQTELTTSGLDAPKNLYFASLLTMMLNNPFAWVQNNPEKGYVLEPVTAGSTAGYDFYHVENPARKLRLQYSEIAARYFFLDENGQEIR